MILRARIYIAIILLLTFALHAAPPNILFILTDDLGYGDVGVFFQNAQHSRRDPGAPSHFTPNIDSLANQGMQLTGYYCPAPVCAPSRASLMLGVHQGHANIRDNQFDKALESNHTIASVLRQAGYATVAIGKWGLQGKGTSAAQWPAYPTKRGFDYYFGYVRHSDGHEHYPKEGIYQKPKEVWDNEKEISADCDKCYTTDLFTARAKKWITDHRATKPGQPFFMYLAYDTPHAVLELPTQAYPKGDGTNGGLQWIGSPGHMINTASGRPDSYMYPDYANAIWKPGPDSPEAPWPNVYKRYASSVRRVDDCMGDLVALLRQLNIETNTLVVFTSDNGPSRESYLPQHYEPDFFHSFGPFDGIKRDSWEGGIRVGAIARLPGVIKPEGNTAFACIASDWMATFADLAGISCPARSDGVSLVPTLTGSGAQRATALYVEYFMGNKTPSYSAFAPAHRGRLRNQMQAIRIGNYMGVRYNIKSADDPFEIYDVVADSKETNNLALRGDFMPLQLQMKSRVLQMRRVNSSAARPYDSVAVPAETSATGKTNEIAYSVFEGKWPWVPNFEKMKAVRSGTGKSFNSALRPRDENFGVLFSGAFMAPAQGEYTFYLQSDSGALVRLHDAILIDDDFNHKAAEVASTIKLAAGEHPFRIYYRHATGPQKLMFEFSCPGEERRPVRP
jgi:arylsulfatase A-like enzyme